MLSNKYLVNNMLKSVWLALQIVPYILSDMIIHGNAKTVELFLDDHVVYSSEIEKYLIHGLIYAYSQQCVETLSCSYN